MDPEEIDFGEIELYGHPFGILDYKFDVEIGDSSENSSISDDEEFSPNRAHSMIHVYFLLGIMLAYLILYFKYIFASTYSLN